MIRANQRAAEANLLKSEHFYDALYERLAERVKRLEERCPTQPTAPTRDGRSGPCASAGTPTRPTAATSTEASPALAASTDATAGATDPLAAMAAAVRTLACAVEKLGPLPVEHEQDARAYRAVEHSWHAIEAAFPAVKAEVERLAREVKEERAFTDAFYGSLYRFDATHAVKHGAGARLAHATEGHLAAFMDAYASRRASQESS